MINKLFFTLAFVAVLFSVSACGNDESDEQQPSISFSADGLQGTWQAITSVTTGCDYPDDNGTTTFNCPDLCQTLLFDRNAYTRTYDYNQSYEHSGTFTISGNDITFCPDSGDDGCSEGSTGRIENGQLILAFVDSDCTDTYTFKKVK